MSKHKVAGFLLPMIKLENGASIVKRVQPKDHLSKKQRRKLRRERAADTKVWIGKEDTDFKEGEDHGESENSPRG